VDYRVLGPIEVVHDGRPVVIAAGKQRALLCCLLVEANRVVSLDRLVDQLWGERPPATAAKNVQVLVSQLRKSLSASGANPIDTVTGGYVLRVQPGGVDVDGFEELLAGGRGLLAAGQAREAERALAQALALWRGRPYEDVAYYDFARDEIARLEDRRLAAEEERYGAMLADGRHLDAASGLEKLAAAHPTRERLVGQLMVALHRCGRRAEALEVYDAARRRLSAELGIAPGESLRGLYATLLEGGEGSAPVRDESSAAGAAVGRRREQRKTVTILFCDVTGSTSLGEKLDPESLRALLARYFERMKAIIESHGGTVEKFIGDAVMAVFGVPALHEDDALRAVRAAVEMRDVLPELGVEGRIGVTTGEVVAGTEERLATGDAVNVAARLEQAARPGEILLGAETLALVRDAVEVEFLEPLALKGKSERVSAYRLVALGQAPRRRLGGVFVGRERELGLLREAFGRVVADRSCQLFTLLGTAGVGKSRLVEEFLGSLDGARVVRGHCLSYGEGITYYPVVEVLLQLSGADPDTAIGELVVDEVAAGALRALLGGEGVVASTNEAAWAFRKLLERIALTAPLVVVFDDIHWGEPTFLELVEHVADLSRDAPILLLCVARPELLDRQVGWGGGKLNATTSLLEPLDPVATDVLIEALLAGGELDEALRARIRDAAGGNPLFVEEMLALVRESGNGHVTVPPTIQALLAARLDQLEPSERGVLERGSVEGKEFHRGAVVALAPEQAAPDAQLMTLVRKDLIRPDRPTLPGEDAYRFRHLLIRDAAYEALPKAVRAELHQLFALWLDERAADLVERDEIVGYHLEQAYRYKAELGQIDDAARAMAAAAAERLGAAGQRAIERADVGAARNLLERTVALLPPDMLDVVLELKLAQTLFMAGDPAAAVACAARTAERAAASGDRLGELHARIHQVRSLAQTDPEGRFEELAALAEEARPLFEQVGYDAGLATLWEAVCDVEHQRCRYDAGAAAAERAIEHARRSGDRQLEQLLLLPLILETCQGTKPVDEYLLWLNDVVARYGDQPVIDGYRSRALGLLGRFEEARALHAKTVAALRERGARIEEGISAQGGWRIEMDAGDLHAAERIARRGCELLEEIGERSFLSTQACQLAESLYALGRDKEAAEWADLGPKLGASDDVLTQMLSRQVLAKLAARRRDHALAQTLIGEAVALAKTTQALIAQADTRMDLAHVLAMAGQTKRAIAELERAAALYERKGATACLARAQQRLDELAAQ
jgi:class 3 adenylate cyclase